MINFFIQDDNVINYNDIDEKKSEIKLQKTENSYFMIYEFQKQLYTNDNNIYYVVLARLSVNNQSNWKSVYKALEENILSLIKTYTLPFDFLKKRKLYDKKLELLIFNNKNINNIITNIEFTQEGFDLITNKFLFTNGRIERTFNFDNNYNYFDNLIKNQDKLIFNKIENYYYNYFLTDYELTHMNLQQIMGYVDYNKNRLENIIIGCPKNIQDEYFKINNWQDENRFLVTFVDSQIELNKNHTKK